MSAPIALQLYTVRQELEQDFAGVVRRIAEIGYVGVEPFTPPGRALDKDAVRLFKELGLTVPAVHGPLPLGEHKNQAQDMLAQLGCKRLICSMLDPSYFTSRDQIKRGCDMLNEAGHVAVANGFSLGYHSHWWEFEPAEGWVPFDVMLEMLDPVVFIELDTYWAKTGGADPVALIGKLGSRAPLLHLKDGAAVLRRVPVASGQADVAAAEKAAFEQSYRAMIADMVALGEGAMDLPAVVKAAQASADWLIVELDACNRDMLTAVELSYRYMVGHRLARGNR